MINLSVCLVQVVLLVEGEDVLVLDQEELSWLVSLGAVGAVVGHLAGGVRVDRLGWKGAALLTCPLFIMGFLLSGLSNSPEILFLAKLVSSLCYIL